MDRFGDFKMAQRLQAGIIGITGYTGLELLRILNAHPEVDVVYATSRQHENTPIGEVYPHLAHMDLNITNTDALEVAKACDVVFLGLPHKTAQGTVAAIHGKTKVIDLSADFRLDDVETYERYYKVKHDHADLLPQIAYGLPEIYRNDIKKCTTIANPGCFALLAQLLTHPFKNKIKAVDFIGITGSSGGGKSPLDGAHHPVRNHNIKSYNINKHRHMPEVCKSAGITEEQINFVPTSGPFTRGIFGQAFITLKDDIDTKFALSHANELYKNEPFIRYQTQVALADIVGSNFADLNFSLGENSHIIAQGAIDNLVKGAAGCAVQNMNILCGLDETLGLKALSPVYP